MIPITLHYRSRGSTHRKRVTVHSVPRIGEKVIPPDEEETMTVLTVEHDIRGFQGHAPTIWVVLD